MINQNLINKVQQIRTTLNEISVYNLDVKTSLELYYELAKKVNEVINELIGFEGDVVEEVKNFETTVNNEITRFENLVSEDLRQQNEKITYMLNEGLKLEVGLKIDELISNGTMDSIINHKIFNDLNSKIDTFKQEVSEQFNTNERKLTNLKNIDYFEDINTIFSETRDGSTIYTPNRVIEIDEPIVWTGDINSKSLIVEGQGFNTIIKASENFVGDCLMYIKPHSTNFNQINLGNLRFYNDNKDIDCLVLDGVGMSFQLEKVFFEGEGVKDSNCAIKVKNHATVATFRDVQIKGFSNCTGLGVEGRLDSVLFERVDIINTKYAVVMSAGSNITYRSCRIDENTYGFVCVGDLLATPNPLQQKGSVMSLNIENCRFEANDINDIVIIGFDTDLSRHHTVNIKNNYFTAINRDGLSTACIKLDKCCHVNIHENKFKGYSGGVGLELVSNIEFLSLKNNEVYGDFSREIKNYSNSLLYNDLTINQSSSHVTIEKTLLEPISIPADGLTTPNIARAKIVRFANTTQTNVSNFVFTLPNYDSFSFGSSVTKQITCIMDGNTRLNNSSYMRLAGGVNYQGKAGDTITLVFTTKFGWTEIARSVNSAE